MSIFVPCGAPFTVKHGREAHDGWFGSPNCSCEQLGGAGNPDSFLIVRRLTAETASVACFTRLMPSNDGLLALCADPGDGRPFPLPRTQRSILTLGMARQVGGAPLQGHGVIMDGVAEWARPHCAQAPGRHGDACVQLARLFGIAGPYPAAAGLYEAPVRNCSDGLYRQRYIGRADARGRHSPAVLQRNNAAISSVALFGWRQINLVCRWSWRSSFCHRKGC